MEQAKGVLMERHGLTADEAYERIRRHARDERISIHEAASRVFTGAISP